MTDEEMRKTFERLKYDAYKAVEEDPIVALTKKLDDLTALVIGLVEGVVEEVNRDS